MSSRGYSGPSWPPSSSSRVRLNGLFADAVWRCNCEPRLPAPKFQTRNGGKNHGRWFYTCQKSAPQGCGFFLWQDDAKAREAATVMSNSRTEPQTPSKRTADSSTIKTPSRPSTRINRFGPASTAASAIASFQSSLGMSQTQTQVDAFEGDDSSDLEDEMTSLADQVSSTPSISTAPRKSIKTGPQASPGKRKLHLATSDNDRSTSPTPARRNGAPVSNISNMLSPLETPRATRFRNEFPETPSKPSPEVVQYPSLLTPTATAGFSTPKSLFAVPSTPSRSPSTLKADIFAVLRDANVKLSPATVESMSSVCEKHARKAYAFEKGRDAVRNILKTKEAALAKSNERNETLLAELEVQQRLNKRLLGERESTVDTEFTQPLGGDVDDTDDEDERARREGIRDWQMVGVPPSARA